MLKKTSGIELPKNHPYFEKIQTDLDRSIRNFDGSTHQVKFYKDCGDHILIPRFYPMHERIEDNSDEGEDITVDCNLIPRNKRQLKAIYFLRSGYSGVLRLEPGSGKSCVAIASICQIGKKSIIFVHKDSLREQWANEIERFTDLKRSDIGFLKTKTYKQDLKCPIIISSVQAFGALLKSHQREFLNELEQAHIGVAIFDEAHTTIGPEQFSKVSLAINSKRVFGLSATPFRSDGCDDIIRYHLGEITYYPPEEDEILKPLINMIYFPFGIYENPKTIKYLTWGSNFSTGRYYQQMYKSERYNLYVSKIINKLVLQDRNILVLGVRKKSLLTLAESCNLPKEKIGIFIPGTTTKERLSVSDTSDLSEAFDTKQVVFSTYNACRDGNNRKSLDALIMACPTSNIEQAIGRIQRLDNNKKQPLVFDLIDSQGPMVLDKIKNIDVPFFVRTSRRRYTFYKDAKWDVKEIVLKTDVGGN
jgi:superfamily II DNA or RNA helicase